MVVDDGSGSGGEDEEGSGGGSERHRVGDGGDDGRKLEQQQQRGARKWQRRGPRERERPRNEGTTSSGCGEEWVWARKVGSV